MNQELSPEAQKLIERVGVSDGPDTATQARVRAALAAALATGTTVAASSANAAAVVSEVASAAKIGSTALGVGQVGGALGTGAGLIGALQVGVSASSLALCLAAGAATGVIVAAGGSWMGSESEPRGGHSASSAEGASNHAESQNNHGEHGHVPSRELDLSRKEAEAPSLPSESASRTEPSRVEKARARGAEPSQVSLSDELALLKNAQVALSEGRADHALRLLDRHAVMYPEGRLYEERQAARVLALCALGQIEKARQYARQFLKEAPGSPLAPRVEGSCVASKL